MAGLEENGLMLAAYRLRSGFEVIDVEVVMDRHSFLREKVDAILDFKVVFPRRHQAIIKLLYFNTVRPRQEDFSASMTTLV